MAMGKKVVLALHALALVCLLLNLKDGTRLMRRLAGDDTAIKNVFTSVNNMLRVPPIPQPTKKEVPLYLALCHELIRQDTIPIDWPFRAFTVVEEDQNVCIDWSSPHLSLLEMISSAMIAVYLPDTKYSNNCDKTQKATRFSPLLNFTTIQQAIGTMSMQHNPDILALDKIKQQCRRCLMSYDEEVEVSRIKANGYHHCFAWPEFEKDKSKVEADLSTIGSAMDPIRAVSCHSMDCLFTMCSDCSHFVTPNLP
jgi:hypothetical protein